NPSDAELDKSTYVSLYGLEEARSRAAALAAQATDALRAAGLDVPPLVELARYVVERDHRGPRPHPQPGLSAARPAPGPGAPHGGRPVHPRPRRYLSGS